MQRITTILQSLKRYFWIAFVAFAISIIFGYVSDTFRAFLDQQLAAIGELAEQIGGQENASLVLFLVIYFNNTIKSIFVVYAGLLLGVYPLFFIAVNGMLIGYLVRLMNENVIPGDLTVWEVIIKGLLPHGIIEIPMLLVAAAYGMKLGWSVWRRLLSMLSGIPNDTISLKAVLKESGPVVAFIAVALFIAALIEAYITPVLLAL